MEAEATVQRTISEAVPLQPLSHSAGLTAVDAFHTPNKASLAFVLWPSDGQDGDSGLEQPGGPSVPTAVAQEARTGCIGLVRLRTCCIEGCTKRPKFKKKCWRHGGSLECTVLGCANRAKTKRLCWTHGGGKLCSVHKCSTIAVSRGICWAHGGGKRCVIQRCIRPAYGNADGLCKFHCAYKNSLQFSAQARF